jgi:hypothetical protein
VQGCKAARGSWVVGWWGEGVSEGVRAWKGVRNRRWRGWLVPSDGRRLTGGLLRRGDVGSVVLYCRRDGSGGSSDEGVGRGWGRW